MKKSTLTFFVIFVTITFTTLNASANTLECQDFSSFKYHNDEPPPGPAAPPAGTGIVVPLSTIDQIHPAFSFYVATTSGPTPVANDYWFFNIEPPSLFPTYLLGYDTYSVAVDSSYLPSGNNPVFLSVDLFNFGSTHAPSYTIEVMDSNNTSHLYTSSPNTIVGADTMFTASIPLSMFSGFQGPIKRINITHAPFGSKLGLVKTCIY